MAVGGNPTLLKAVTISDSSISAYRIVKGDTTDTTNSLMVCAAATASTVPPIGVTTDATTAADEKTTIVMGGIALVNVDGSGTAIDIGTAIVATTGGQGIAASAASNTAQYILGYALEPSAAAGDVIQVLIAPTHITNGVDFTDAPVVETVTAAAPALTTEGLTLIDSTSNAVDGTLADGTYTGQTKKIVMINASNSSTVTVAKHETSDPEVFTFDAVGEYLSLIWDGAEWDTVTKTATV